MQPSRGRHTRELKEEAFSARWSAPRRPAAAGTGISAAGTAAKASALAAVRRGEELVSRIGRSHRDDIAIRGQKQRRRFRAGIAAGRNQNDSLGRGRRQALCDKPVLPTGKAHIDDAGALEAA